MNTGDVISVVIAIWMGILGCLAVMEKLGRNKFRTYLDRHESCQIGTLKPRFVGISIRGGFAFLAVIAAAVCAYIGAVNFALIFSIGGLFFLVPAILLWSTKIRYNHDVLIVDRLGKQRCMPMANLARVEQGTSTSKGRWIKLVFSSGQSVFFEQIDYVGIPIMFEYMRNEPTN